MSKPEKPLHKRSPVSSKELLQLIEQIQTLAGDLNRQCTNANIVEYLRLATGSVKEATGAMLLQEAQHRLRLSRKQAKLSKTA